MGVMWFVLCDMFAILLTDPTRGQLILRDIPLGFGCTFRYPMVELIYVYILCILSSALPWRMEDHHVRSHRRHSDVLRLAPLHLHQVSGVLRTYLFFSFIVQYTLLSSSSRLYSSPLEVKYTQDKQPRRSRRLISVSVPRLPIVHCYTPPSVPPSSPSLTFPLSIRPYSNFASWIRCYETGIYNSYDTPWIGFWIFLPRYCAMKEGGLGRLQKRMRGRFGDMVCCFALYPRLW